MVIVSSRGPYPNAPIVEAVLEIQCRAGGVSASELRSIFDAEREAYPQRQEISNVAMELQAKFQKSEVPVTATSTRTPAGWAAISADRLQIVRVLTDRFAFSRLQPYLGWAQFSAEAKRMWSSYRDVARPTSLTRLAIRTINRLEFSGPMADPSEYLQTLPVVGEGVGDRVEGFFMQVVVPQPAVRGTATITEATAPTQNASSVALILDIDLWRTEDLPSDDDDLWSILASLREQKDALFEACITDKTREMFRS